MAWLSTLASLGMATGPPLVYLDQYMSIRKTKSSQGFSHAICLVLLTANITRLFYWLGERFDTALLVQSILMIIAQAGLLKVCLRYCQLDRAGATILSRDGPFNEEPESLTERETLVPPTLSHPPSGSPGEEARLNLAEATSEPPASFDAYVDAFALLIALEAGLFIILQRYNWFIQLIGFLALGLESTLPIPQLLTNHRRKSLSGFSPYVLFGWLLGDGFKSIYLILLTPASNPLQFKLCALFQLSIDCLIVVQAILYRQQTQLDCIKLGSDDHAIHHLSPEV